MELTEENYINKVCLSKDFCFMKQAQNIGYENNCDCDKLNNCKLIALVNLYIKDNKLKQSPNVIKIKYPVKDILSTNVKSDAYCIDFIYDNDTVSIIQAYIRKN